MTRLFIAIALLINGAGATFPYPIYSKWFAAYHRLHSDVALNYQAIGSGAGIRQITERTVDFGASDAPMTDREMASAKGVLELPTVLGAVVVTYHVPGAPGDLKLTPEAIAGLFLGKITKWNDPALEAANPGVKLPDLTVAVAHRSDGSGTTAIFTDYLSKVSPEWKSRVGAGKSVKWPTGLGGKGNQGVTGLVQSIPGAVGYVELAYAHQNHLPVSPIRNHAGVFVMPTLKAISAAGAVPMPPDFRVSITDSPVRSAYPISAFTYLLVYQNQTDAAKGTALIHFLSWAMHDGQKLAAALDYGPLPASVVRQVDARLKSITVQGRRVLATSR